MDHHRRRGAGADTRPASAITGRGNAVDIYPCIYANFSFIYRLREPLQVNASLNPIGPLAGLIPRYQPLGPLVSLHKTSQPAEPNNHFFNHIESLLQVAALPDRKKPRRKPGLEKRFSRFDQATGPSAMLAPASTS